ncbi:MULTISPECIES: restriction endonuclease subunit S [Klebsiella]|uniref:restriction endonuclease subunit S n=1 Tax=Klebsiella TaxID=570 RepID=UPI001BCBC2A4|nr:MULTISPECIES: restriction endonuclease subunit S [Klebsiella]MBZ4206556.1 restriction endonuclease subunit S [Klebsiella aerogenes]MBZ4215478.1 restriction endonuclease subunit S [Klebsiella aerogenes]MBZ5779701.1 restriction endonuclease subunit S [Klebsiella aerogenes]QVJ10555.1 restriction endonuclease subunit S [Klebsiella sp. A52]
MVFEGSVPNGWKLVKLSDLGEVNRGKSKHRPRDAAFLYGGSYPFIQTGDVKASDGRITSYNQTYSEAGLKQSRLWPSETMCITIAANIAETGILTFPACFPDSIIGFIADKKQCDVYFIEYLFRLLKKRIQAQANGSVQDNINLQTLERIIFPVPEIRIQKNISNFLKKLDDKIILNKETNQTLEQMSQTLFKSWFVDFDPVIDNALDAGNPIPEALQSRAELRQKVRNSENFKPLPADIRTLFPAEFEETELGWVPRDWYYVPLKNLGKIICGKTPDKSNKEYYGKDYLFIKIPDMHGKVFVTNSTDKLSTLGSETQIKKLIPKGSICVSCIATVGIVAINSKDCHTNQQINSIVPNSSILRNYLYFSMLEKNKTFHDLASGGSATLNMNTGIFSNVLTLKPEDSVLERFQQTSEHWFGRILANENEIHTLTALRDTLLPKLISGELSLEDLPDLVTQTEPA